MTTRRLIRKLFAKSGYAICRRPSGIGGDSFADMAALVNTRQPVIFDVGANVGQSIQFFRSWFKDAEVHSFEPSPATFQKLKMKAPRDTRIHLWNHALGSGDAELEFLEYTLPECSSFLPPGRCAPAAVAGKTSVPVRTVDDFCVEHDIKTIDILKSDTQGYELEVFKGSRRMFASGSVGLVFCEMIIAEQYKGVPSFGHLYNFLIDQGFLLVSFYDLFYENGLAAWTDGLFIHGSRVNR